MSFGDGRSWGAWFAPLAAQDALDAAVRVVGDELARDLELAEGDEDRQTIRAKWDRDLAAELDAALDGFEFLSDRDDHGALLSFRPREVRWEIDAASDGFEIRGTFHGDILDAAGHAAEVGVKGAADAFIEFP